MSIATQLANVLATLPSEVTLVAVSKTKPIAAIAEAYEAGHRHFGENRVAELQEKAPALPDDIVWHFIGHLQTKKVKHVVPHASLIHSLDSTKLLEEINKRAAQHNRTIDCLIQVHIATESTKYGFDFDEVRELLASELPANLPNVRIVGLMGMATFTDNEAQVRSEFASLGALFDELKNPGSSAYEMRTLSMGMSGDYTIAMEEGSNMVRIGTAIFGAR